MIARIRTIVCEFDAEFGPGAAAAETPWLIFIAHAAPLLLLGLAILLGEH
ncbi:MAG: hypothetical protein MUF47_00840 [Porphyrobacter sp.]|nr:hypothetical protein [Porphyrobacter sp.]